MFDVLSEEQGSRFSRDGILFPITVLTRAEARRFRDAANQLEDQLGGKPRTVEVRQMHLHFPWAFELATHPRVLDAVADLVGPTVLIWATELFAKHPQDPSVSIAWHRDRPYMGFASGSVVTAWIALEDSTPENGCMRAVPRSRESLDDPGDTPSGSLPAAKQECLPQDKLVSDRAVDIVLPAGAMSLHDPDILHGSGPNLSPQKRIGFVVRFVSAAARPVQGRPRVLRARGHEQCPQFDLIEPRFAAPDQALGGLRLSATEHFDAVLHNLQHARR
jgi:ectoine hydroxylase-related dioxygenase (phytanoyl-CoA dioxygenase family)